MQSALDGYPCDAKVSASARLVEAAVEEAFLEGWGRMEMTEVVSSATEHHQQLALLTEQIDELPRARQEREEPSAVGIVESSNSRSPASRARRETPPRLSTIRALGMTYGEHYLARTSKVAGSC